MEVLNIRKKNDKYEVLSTNINIYTMEKGGVILDKTFNTKKEAREYINNETKGDTKWN